MKISFSALICLAYIATVVGSMTKMIEAGAFSPLLLIAVFAGLTLAGSFLAYAMSRPRRRGINVGSPFSVNH